MRAIRVIRRTGCLWECGSAGPEPVRRLAIPAAVWRAAVGGHPRAAQVGIQVKRSYLTLRFTRAEWSRMEADATRLGWRWVVAAVSPDETVMILDPAHARHGCEVRLHDSAAIANLPRWVDEDRK